MTDRKTEALAMAYASIEGRLDEFMLCKTDNDAEDRLGRYGGYMAEAEQMRRFMRRRGFYIGFESSLADPATLPMVSSALDDLQHLGQECDSHD